MSTRPPRTQTTSPIDELVEVIPWPEFTEEQWAAHDAEIAAKRRAERDAEEYTRARRKQDALMDAGFPRRAIDCALAADANTPAISRVRTWRSTRACVLVLAGPKGIGKTVAATWWALQQACTPAFVRATTFAASSRYDRDDRERWLGAPALVLDDLGTEFADAKGSFLVDIDELIDVFYGDRKPLVITTNSTREEFAERYGERIVDRLRECGVFWVGAIESLRRKGAP
jgi:DNA replication protein DnaC